ncbi:Uncharacterized protein TCM_001515 [Theobroma cacao]|uniref:Uncharacterized protein n=1 Tax=Theobroma cacao TaxID=3641 RepID=A0A061DKJ4_THECC|nr:Uncharacterized protein TCM_001515 [Theobroma cacao]
MIAIFFLKLANYSLPIVVEFVVVFYCLRDARACFSVTIISFIVSISECSVPRFFDPFVYKDDPFLRKVKRQNEASTKILQGN